MIGEDIAESVLKEASSNESVVLAEVRLEKREKRQISVRAGQVSSIMSGEDSGMNVRIVLPSGIGFASVNDISRESGRKLLRTALKQAKNGRRRTPASMSQETPVRTSWEVRQKKPLADRSVDDRLGFLKEVDAAVMKTGVKVQGRYYELKEREITGFFANSEGSRIGSFLPRLKMEAFNIVSAKGQTEQSFREWGASGGWEKVEEWEVAADLVEEVKMLKLQIERGKRVKPGTYDLVCGPEVVGIASHESCGHPMEADRILGREMSQAGRSFVTPEDINKVIGSKYVNVLDDPTIPGSYGFYVYDQEGVKARPRYLYKQGLMNEFLHNRETASKLGTRSNGSSRSETYICEPIVRMANTFVAPGDFQEDELTGSIKRGILMNSFTEWNIDDKRYNQKYVSREAHFIDDGELGGPARRCVLEITTPGFWGAVDAVSKKVEFSAAECGKGDPGQSAAVFTGGPMIRLRGVTLK